MAQEEKEAKTAIFIVVKRKKTRRGTSTVTHNLTGAQIKKMFPYWDGRSTLLMADYRLGTVIEIKAPI